MRRALMWLCASLLLPGCALGPDVETAGKARPSVKVVKRVVFVDRLVVCEKASEAVKNSSECKAALQAAREREAELVKAKTDLGYAQRERDELIKNGSDDVIRKILITHSIEDYNSRHVGSCPCPYSPGQDVDPPAAGTCGPASAYCLQRGESPLCYKEDIDVDMLMRYRKSDPQLQLKGTAQHSSKQKQVCR